MVYILLILLFISDKINSFKDQTNKNVKLTLLTEFFWLAKERKIRTRNKGINKRNILSSLFFKCLFRFQYVGNGEFHNDGKYSFFILLT